MAKKSRKTAARYSELSRAGKKKQRAKGPAQAQAEVQTETEVKAQPEAYVEPELKVGVEAQPQPRVQAQQKSRSQTVSVSTSRETVQPRGATGAGPRARSEAKLMASGSEMVRSDLKRIGILAGAMLAILIVLAFTLG